MSSFAYPFEHEILIACWKLSDRFSGNETSPYCLYVDHIGRVLRIEFKISRHEIEKLRTCTCRPPNENCDVCHESFLYFDSVDDSEVCYWKIEWQRITQSTMERLCEPLILKPPDFIPYQNDSTQMRELIDNSFPETWSYRYFSR